MPVAPGENPFLPQASFEGEELSLTNVLLGHKQQPQTPRTAFYQVMRDLGRREAEETFEKLQHINRLQFYKLDSLSEFSAPALGRLLRDVARYQLDAMSYSIGSAP